MVLRSIGRATTRRRRLAARPMDAKMDLKSATIPLTPGGAICNSKV